MHSALVGTISAAATVLPPVLAPLQARALHGFARHLFVCAARLSSAPAVATHPQAGVDPTTGRLHVTWPDGVHQEATLSVDRAHASPSYGPPPTDAEDLTGLSSRLRSA